MNILTAQDIDPKSQLGKNIKEVNRLTNILQKYSDKDFTKVTKRVAVKLRTIETKIEKINEKAPNYADLPSMKQNYTALKERYNKLMGLGNVVPKSKPNTDNKPLKIEQSSIGVTNSKDPNIKEAHRLLGHMENYDDKKLMSGSTRSKLVRLENKIGKIKESFPDYPRLKELEAGYAKYKKKNETLAGNNSKKNKIGSDLTNHYSFRLNRIEIPRSWAKELSMTYEEFTAMKNEFISLGGNETSADIPESEQFYTQKMASTVLPAVEKEINEVFTKIGTGWKGDPKNAIYKIERLVRDVGFLKNHATASAANIANWKKLNSKCVAELARLKDYRDNGGYAQYEVERKQKIIDDRMLRPRKMATPQDFNRLITTSIRETKPGARVNIIHVKMSSWGIRKHELTGVPLKKFIEFDAAVTDANGVCFRVPGIMFRDYEGGGNYGGKYVYLMYLNDQMNCSNIPK